MWCKIGTKSRCEWEFFLQGLLIYPAHTLSPAQCPCQNCKLPEMLGWQETGGETHESIWPQLWRQDAIEESRIYFKIWYIKATRCDILSLTVANVCFKVNAVWNIHTLLQLPVELHTICVDTHISTVQGWSCKVTSACRDMLHVCCL